MSRQLCLPIHNGPPTPPEAEKEEWAASTDAIASASIQQRHKQQATPSNRLHSGFAHALTRKWQGGPRLTKENFVYPIFISSNADDNIAIPSMPGQVRLGINRLENFMKPLVAKGLTSVILFGVIDPAIVKDARGSLADSEDTPVIQGVKLIRGRFPEIYVMCDVCLCEYTDHGHCGVLDSSGSLDNSLSVQRMADVAVRYAQVGAHCVAPSDMNDSRVAKIKEGLTEHGLAHRVSLMSYSAKFHSSLYGPFRDAAASQPLAGDRSCYQLPPGARGLARRAIERDVMEGADFIMVKPAGNYLDIVRDACNISPNTVIAAYQVSGEYAALHAAAKAGVASLKDMAFESCEAMLRAGASIIMSYFTPEFLDWLSMPIEG